MTAPVLPAGFTLDSPEPQIKLPDGFTLDAPGKKLKGSALDAIDIVKQFVTAVPRGVAQSLDTGKLANPLVAAPQLVRDYIHSKVIGGKEKSAEELVTTVIPKPEADTKAGEYAGTIGELTGGSILPGLGWMGAARGIAQRAVTAPATSFMGRMVQNAATQTAANPGRAIAYDLASNATGGMAQQFVKDEGAGPVGQTVAAIGGGMLPAIPSMVAGPVNRFRGMMANQGQTGAYNRLATQLPDGDVDTFANQVATGGMRNNQAIQRRTLDILGEEMERAAGDRGQAIQSTINRIVREVGVTPATARSHIRNLTGVHRDSPLMLAEYTAAAPSNAAIRSTRNVDNLDLRDVARPADSGTQQAIDYLANRPGQSAINVRNAVNERNLGMRDVMREGLEEFGPVVPGTQRRATIEDLAQMQEGARRSADLAYRQTYQPGMTNDRMLFRFLPRILDGHVNRMRGRAGAPAQALRNAVDEFFITRPNGQRIAMMDLQMLQDARGSLRNQIDKARKSGDTQIAGTLQPLYRDITRLMERANPNWARANREWADLSINEVAQELGEAFSVKAGPQYRQQVDQYRQLAPEAQDMVRVQFLKKLTDRLENIRDTEDPTKLFNTDHMRNAIRELFGDRAAVEMARLTRDSAIAAKSGNAIKGSQTHMRGQVAKEFDADTGVMAAAQDMNVRGIRSAMLDKLWSFFTERRNLPMSQIATTPMQDTAEVARHVHNMRVAQEFVRRVQAQRPMPATPPIALTGIGSAITSDEAKR